MDRTTVEKKIDELMMEDNIFGDIVDYELDDNDNVTMIAVEITWGDWKHDHLRMDWLMRGNFSNLERVETQTTEEDGSDCYSAVHYYYFD